MKVRTFMAHSYASNAGKEYYVTVYGELEETKKEKGFVIYRTDYSPKSHIIDDMDEDWTPILIEPKTGYHCRTRNFNMGFSILNITDGDIYDEATAITIAKRRFSKSPISTQNFRFLNPDMIQAMVNFEVQYIADNLAKFLPKTEEINDVTEEPIEETTEEKDWVDELFDSVPDKEYSEPVVAPVPDCNDIEECADEEYAPCKDGEWCVYNCDGDTMYKSIGVVKSIDWKSATVDLYWAMEPSVDGKWKLIWDRTVQIEECPKEAKDWEIETGIAILKADFHKRWCDDCKKFKVVID